MGTAPKAPRPPDPLPPGIQIGDVVLDRYRVVEPIASGGHSVVFRGQDERLARPVCIKVFSGLGGDSGLGRTSYEHFVQEAFALSRLTHPNTLRIYDFGHLGARGVPDKAGLPLQVCEFMNGGTLSNIIREQGLQTLAETARVIGAMCAALAEAHALGIVHRDIKPQNILFGTVGGARLPKLADFGIAKWSADEREPEPKRAEDTAIVAGQKLAMYSPSWAAPEQLAGQPVSAATDIYSLAAVAVYMLSGKAIFADEDVYAGYKKRRQPEELVREALEPLRVPRGAIGIISRALAFDPKRRPAAVSELSAGLDTAIELATPRAAAEPAGYQLATPTVPTPAITPPGGLPTRPPPAPAPPQGAAPRPSVPSAPPAPPVVAAVGAPVPPVIAPGAAPTPPAIPPAAAPRVWQPPVVQPPWMQTAPAPAGPPVRLPLLDVPQHLGDRNVHFVAAPTGVVDLIGSQAQKVRVTFLNAPGGVRVIHVKGMTCFVAVLGGRPSPAVQLDQPGDLALVTPRAQEIGHIRVASPTAEGAYLMFPLGGQRVAVAVEDCTDPILFDFGPGSEAYFVYTRGRAAPRTRRR